MSHVPLHEHLLSIWMAGIDAVRSERLMNQAVQCNEQTLTICGQQHRLADVGRIVVVGAGKAGAGMASAFESILGPDLVDARVSGLINVPADCVRTLRRIRLNPGRPAGLNEPTAAGVAGTETILSLVAGLESRDLCLVLLSGGGSALLPAPIAGISLADKQSVTRFLSSAGATIHELNTVRKRLSRIKGGGLARACRTGKMTTLIISDVVGDPLDIIASGPTVLDSASPQTALAVLRKFGVQPPDVPQSIFDVLEQASLTWQPPDPLPDSIRNVVIGNNSIALAASTAKAQELGYEVLSFGSENQGDANLVGQELYLKCREQALEFLNPMPETQGLQSRTQRPLCLLSGGEPTVKLPGTKSSRKGGRNQQLVLAALSEAWNDSFNVLDCIGILSGGTDGEDGPTDAAGAWFDATTLQSARSLNLNPIPFLNDCNAYPFFERCGGLIKTGPTHTNVMDLRLALIV